MIALIFSLGKDIDATLKKDEKVERKLNFISKFSLHL